MANEIRYLAASALLAALAGCGTEPPPPTPGDEAPPPPPVIEESSLATAIAGEHRSAENRARDVYRHPQETLEFFGIRPDMTVVEIWPSAGWFTEILAPYLHDKGRYIAAHWDPATQDDYVQRNLKVYAEKLAAHPALYGKVEMAVLSPPEKLEFVPAGTADMVVTFRNVHNWMDAGQAEAVFAAMYRALKPGGVLGVEEHRAAGDKPQDPRAESGYVRQDYVTGLAERAGFVLEATSEINANPRDTSDHPEGVWTLPPTLALGDKDREKYLAVGESDRATLRFRKPGSSAGVGEGAAPAMDDVATDGGETVAPAP
ncbi:MAG: class I SAM-dependent methyltransferase [Gammaproteobacteria bacterium]|nr:class I SAM-dependent methyltransferase [Gammaproteobacteria bacterium]